LFLISDLGTGGTARATLHVVNGFAASVHDSGVYAPLPLLTLRLTVPVGFAFVTATGGVLVSKPVSVTDRAVARRLIEVPDRLRTSVVVVAWPVDRRRSGVGVGLKKPLRTGAPLPGRSPSRSSWCSSWNASRSEGQ
jgi:hypothetical protein